MTSKRLIPSVLSVWLLLITGVAHAQTAKPAAKDEVAGMSRERLARIAPVMSEQIEKGIFPGAVTLVARRGTVVHSQAHGFRDAAKSQPMTKDSIFRLASMTKPIVTVAAMMLVERGAMKLNDPIATWLPELKEMKVETQAGDVATISIWLTYPTESGRRIVAIPVARSIVEQ